MALVHRYKFESNANDSVGSNNGVLTTLSGTGYSTDAVTYSTRSLAADSKIVISGLNDVFTANPLKFTFSFWFKKNGTPTKYFNLTAGSNQNSFSVTMNQGNYLYFYVGSGSQFFNYYSNTTVTLPNDVWTNIIYTHDSTLSDANKGKLYVNNVLKSISYSGTQSLPLASVASFTINELYNQSGQNVIIDDLRIYDNVVDSSERIIINLGEFTPPAITSIDPSTFISNGALLRIYGTNLEGSSTTEITIDGVDYTANITSTSSTLITMIAPGLASASYDLVVIADSIESDPYSITYSSRSLLEMPIRCPVLYQHYDNDDGTPLALGKIYTYAAGTSTPLATLLSDGTTEAANPVILDAAGNANVYLKPGFAYKFVVKTSADVTISNGTQDNITADNTGVSNAVVVETIAEMKLLSAGAYDYVQVLGYTAKTDNIGPRLYYWDSASTTTDDGGSVIKITATTTGRWKLVAGKEIDAKWFGATGDSTTNDYTALYNANAYVNSLGGGVLVLSKGQYNITSALTFSTNVEVRFLPGAYLKSSNSSNLTLYFTNHDCMDLRFASTLGTITLGSDIGKVYPEWFGALGNGTTSDSTEIQKALDSYSVVEFNNATYGVGTGLSVPVGRKLICKNTILIPTVNSNNVITLVENTDVSTATKIEGTLKIKNTLSKTGNTGFVATKSQGLKIDCLEIESLETGFSGSNSYHQQIDTLTIKSCSLVGLNLQSSPTGTGSLVGNLFNNTRLEANAVGLYMNAASSSFILNDKFNSLILKDNTVCGAFFDSVTNTQLSNVWITGNGSGAASITVGSDTVYKSDLYLKSSNISLTDSETDSSLNNSIQLVTSSTLITDNYTGYGSSSNTHILCDSTSKVVEKGVITANGYVTNIWSFGALKAIDGSFRATGIGRSHQSIGKNFFAGSIPQTPQPTTSAPATSSYLKTDRGLTRSTTFAGSVGSDGTNSIEFSMGSGMAGDYQISTILIRASAGSKTFTIKWEDNSASYSNDVTLNADTDSWKRLIFITAGKTTHNLIIFPPNTEGATLYYADAMVWDGDLESISNVYQSCTVHLNKFGNFLSAAPSSGTWDQGDWTYYTAPTAGGVMGAVCTTGGTPGTWKEWGAISV